MTEHQGLVDTVARGKAAEALQAMQSLERMTELRFANVDARFHDVMAQTSASETRANTNQTNGESRLKSEMSAIEGRLLSAIGKLESAMNAQSALYSNRFWDTSTKIIFGLVGAIWAAAFAYSMSRVHG